MNYVDTHAHIDGAEFDADRDEVVARARAAGVSKVLVPAIDLASVGSVLRTCDRYPGFAYPMAGLHPEEVRADFRDVLATMRSRIDGRFVAIGEVGIDYYWSREFEKEQLEAFEEQVRWSVELRRYRGELPGGVFHCFTGNEREAEELLAFDNFALGIGGVLTFKKSHLPEVLPHIPLQRIVLETDSPYMAPVPMRGKRNESAFVSYVLARVADCYGVSQEAVAEATNATVERIFGIKA